jgi:hypothetical protein
LKNGFAAQAEDAIDERPLFLILPEGKTRQDRR